VIAEHDNGAGPRSPSREYIYSGGPEGSGLLAKIDSSGTRRVPKIRYEQRQQMQYLSGGGETVANCNAHFPSRKAINSSRAKPASRSKESRVPFGMSRLCLGTTARRFEPG